MNNHAEMLLRRYEKLEHWNDALEAYELKQLEDPASVPCNERSSS